MNYTPYNEKHTDGKREDRRTRKFNRNQTFLKNKGLKRDKTK